MWDHTDVDECYRAAEYINCCANWQLIARSLVREANVALEFRTRDESYTGPALLPKGETIWQASIYVDHLPPGFPTAHYRLHLVPDRYSHIPRYVIDAIIMIHRSSLLLAVVGNATLSPNRTAMLQVITNASIERDGLDILMLHHGQEYQGLLFPIPEQTAEAR